MRYASAASCSARIAPLAKFSLPLRSWAISHTSLWKGSLLINSSVDFWNRRISWRATVPGLYRCGFLGAAVCAVPLFCGGLAHPSNGLCALSHAISEGASTFGFSPSCSLLTVRRFAQSYCVILSSVHLSHLRYALNLPVIPYQL